GRPEWRLREDCCRVDEIVVVAQSEERLRPEVFPPAAHEDAVVAVVVETRETSVEIDRRPEKTAADGQRHHVLVGGHWRQKVAPHDKGWGEPRLFIGPSARRRAAVPGSSTRPGPRESVPAIGVPRRRQV